MQRSEWGAKQALTMETSSAFSQSPVSGRQGFVRLKEHDWKFEGKSTDFTGMSVLFALFSLKGQHTHSREKQMDRMSRTTKCFFGVKQFCSFFVCLASKLGKLTLEEQMRYF